MSKRWNRNDLNMVLVVGLCLLAALTPAAANDQKVGRLDTRAATVNGVAALHGDPLPNPALVLASDGPAVVVLDNGQVLHLNDYSSVHLERLDDRRVQVEVRSGRIVVESVGERHHSAGRNSRFILEPSVAAKLRLAGMSQPVDSSPRPRPSTDKRDRD